MNNPLPVLHFITKLFLFCILNFSGQLKAQSIPIAKTVDWSVVGFQGEIPKIINFKNFLNVAGADNNNVNDNATIINSAIAAFGGQMSVLYFPTGTYKIGSTILVPSNIIIKGAGSDSTSFNFTNSQQDCFTVTGTAGSFVNATGGYTFKSKQLTLATIAGLAVDDLVALKQTNGSWYTTPIQRGWADDAVGQLFKIVEINNSTNTIIVDKEVRYVDYQAALNPQVQKITASQYVGFEDFKMFRTGITLPTNATGSSIIFNYAYNCWIKGVESIKAEATHFAFFKSKNIEVSGCYLHQCYNYDGTSARGYGFRLESWTSDCLIENNITDSLRHAIMFKVGANGNVAGYNYHDRTYRVGTCAPFNCSTDAADVVFHGHLPYANLVEGHIGRFVNFDQEWGPNGPKNTLFRSRQVSTPSALNGNRALEIATQAYQFGLSFPSWYNDSFNIVNNEITGTAPTYSLNYNASTQYICGNNVNGTINPAACGVNDNSLYYTKQPYWWSVAAGSWPSIGAPALFNTGTNPAKVRYGTAPKTYNSNNTNKPKVGTIRFNINTNKLEGFNGHDWPDL